VDLTRFRPGGEHPELAGLPRPILICVGRLAVEKNLEAFLRLPLPGTKVMIGDGPLRAMLAARYPQARFLGYRLRFRRRCVPRHRQPQFGYDRA
jgi:hypothetical protein